MIKLNNNARLVRETRAPFEYEENGETKTADIRVRFYGRTVRELREFEADMKARKDQEIVWVSEVLVRRLESLPDLVGDDDRPVPVTLEFLEGIDLKNLKAIEQAIQDAENPK